MLEDNESMVGIINAKMFKEIKNLKFQLASNCKPNSVMWFGRENESCKKAIKFNDSGKVENNETNFYGKLADSSVVTSAVLDVEPVVNSVVPKAAIANDIQMAFW